MAVGDIIPNGDAGPNAWAATSGWCTESTHAECIDESKGSPSMTDQIRAEDADDGDIESFNMTTITPIASFSQIKVWTYGAVVVGGNRPTVYVLSETPQTVGLPIAVAGWTSNTFTVSGNQSDLDGIKVTYTAGTIGKFDVLQVGCVYAEVTYEEPAAGYGHDFMGVPAANIDEVNGVPTANIDNIKGV